MEIKRKYKPIRTSAVLTTSYVAGTVIGEGGASPSGNLKEYSQVVLYVSFTKGSLTSAEIKIEFSEDGSAYYQETMETESAGTTTETLLVRQFSASGNYRIAVPINDRYMRVSANGTGTVTGSLMAIGAVLAVN